VREHPREFHERNHGQPLGVEGVLCVRVQQELVQCDLIFIFFVIGLSDAVEIVTCTFSTSTPQAGQPASPSTPSAVGYLPPLCGIITNVLSSNNPHSSFGDSDSGACGDGSGVARRSPSHWV
jgi:hypothetical protein